VIGIPEQLWKSPWRRWTPRESTLPLRGGGGACRKSVHAKNTRGPASTLRPETKAAPDRPQSTQVYRQVSIRNLKQIHRATHPGAQIEHKKPAASATTGDDERLKTHLLAALDHERDEEEE
jgi:hypothetical protein